MVGGRPLWYTSPKRKSGRNALWIENTSPSRLIVLLSEVTLASLGFDGGRLARPLENTNRSISVFHIDGVGVGPSRRSWRKQYARMGRQRGAVLSDSTTSAAPGPGLRVTNEGVPGDTTGEMLARLASAVPDGTKIVILQFGTNDARLNTPRATRHANIAAILEELRKRGIRSVQVDELMDAALRDGLVQSDGIHLTAEGYRRIATQLLPSIL